MRVGLIANKIGMTSIFDKDGLVVPITLLEVKDCEVVGIKTCQKDGYNALQVGCINAKNKHVTKPIKGSFAKNKVLPKKKVKEFKVSDDCMLEVGTHLSVNHFMVGQFVDVQAISIGKGFSGVMKRWNFSGLAASHGVSISHRSHGSTGQCQDPGKVFKGKKMAGQLGNETVTTQNLKVVVVDASKNIIALKGAVPGSKGSYVFLSDAIKRALPANVPYPTFFDKEEVQTNQIQGASE